MIVGARQIHPFIHFGFNRLTFMQKQVAVKIRVFIDGNFNKDVYTVSVISTGATATMITDRIYDIEYGSSGLKDIHVEFTNIQTSEVFLSNTIQTEQLYYTFDSTELGFDNTIVTFDNEQL